MFAYNPTVNDRSGEILAQGIMQQNAIRASQQQELAGNIGDAIASIADMYSDRKMAEAKASSYDDIGKILSGGMFSNNPEAAQAFSNIAKQKDPYKKNLAYEQIFDLLGPLSNAQMAQNRFGYSSELANQQAAARNQVPANQQPVSLGTTSAPQGITPSYMAKIPPRPQQQP